MIMANQSGPVSGAVVPAMRYRDLAGAIEWLCATFGFTKDNVAMADDGRVVFAQLKYGSSMVMLGPVSNAEIDSYMRQPDEIGGAETQSCYLVVHDLDAHRARAEAAGAEVIIETRDFDFGGRGYSCRDPEGHIWNFGTYLPGGNPPSHARSHRRAIALSSLVIALVGAMAAWVGTGPGAETTPVQAGRPAAMAPEPHLLAAGRPPAAPPAKAAPYTAMASHYAVVAADRPEGSVRQRRRLAATRIALHRSQSRIAVLIQAKENAELGRRQTEAQLLAERSAKYRSEEIVRDIGKQLAAERAAKEKAERSLETMQAKLKQAQAVPNPVAKNSVQAKPQKPQKAAKARENATADPMPGLIP